MGRLQVATAQHERSCGDKVILLVTGHDMNHTRLKVATPGSRTRRRTKLEAAIVQIVHENAPYGKHCMVTGLGS